MSDTYCARCARVRRAGEWRCPACGCDAYDDVVAGTARPRKRGKHPLAGVLGRVVELPPGGLLLLHGPRGVGKTSVALGALDRPWLVTSEMEPEELLRYARRLGARVDRVSRPTWIEEELRLDLGEPPAGRPRDLVLDSATATGHAVEALVAVRAHVRELGVRAIVLVHETKDGLIRGSSSLGFDCDVDVRIDYDAGARRIEVLKNRFGAEAELRFELGEDGPRLPAADRYYSVEGRPGAYRLEPWPADQARHAAYLRAVEAARAQEDGPVLYLPPPPVAVAALPSTLYARGWIEPPDVAGRKAYAQAQGVPYFSPLE